jgi:hypothetical protein
VIRIPRWLVAFLGVLFGLFHAGLGFASLNGIENYGYTLTAIIMYLIATLVSMILYRGPDLPLPQAIFNLAVAALVPLLVNSNLDADTADAYSTWYVMGIATLMATTAVRQQKLVAWLGMAILAIQVVLWAGLFTGIQTGLIGALMLVFAAHTISVGLKSAYRRTMKFTQDALASQTQAVSNEAAGKERSVRLDQALQGALPLLQQIQSQKGKLTVRQKNEARLLEASLRDEIRGRGLMTDSIRNAARSARTRGVEVIILDEGGLDEVVSFKRKEILDRVAETIDQVQEGRITLRAPSGETWKVTLVASRSGIAKPDIWIKF